MNYSKSIFAVIVLLAITYSIVFGQNLKAVPRKTEQPKHLSEEEILKLLPKGAQFADGMPIIQPEGENTKKKDKQEYIYYADVNNDSIDEIIVAYYWVPEEPGPDATVREKEIFEGIKDYERAHVAVLSWDGKKYINKWDSGGGGREFLACTHTKDGNVPKEDVKYAENCFSVRDITGDKVPEIITTTVAPREAGCIVWSWDGETYKIIARTAMSARIEDIDKDGVNEIIVDYVPSDSILKSPIIYKWNGKEYEEHSEFKNK
jgi:hypothetical protein